MSAKKWAEFRDQVAEKARTAGGADVWLAYGHPLKNGNTVRVTAYLMRKRFPELVVRHDAGVIYARMRHQAPQEARTA